MGLGLGCSHNKFMNASLKVDEIKVNLKQFVTMGHMYLQENGRMLIWSRF